MESLLQTEVGNTFHVTTCPNAAYYYKNMHMKTPNKKATTKTVLIQDEMGIAYISVKTR